MYGSTTVVVAGRPRNPSSWGQSSIYIAVPHDTEAMRGKDLGGRKGPLPYLSGAIAASGALVARLIGLAAEWSQ